MFGFLKRKTKKEKLQEQYKKLLKQAFEISKYNRKLSDELTFEANEVLKQIEECEKNE